VNESDSIAIGRVFTEGLRVMLVCHLIERHHPSELDLWWTAWVLTAAMLSKQMQCSSYCQCSFT